MYRRKNYVLNSKRVLMRKRRLLNGKHNTVIPIHSPMVGFINNQNISFARVVETLDGYPEGFYRFSHPATNPVNKELARSLMRRLKTSSI